MPKKAKKEVKRPTKNSAVNLDKTRELAQAGVNLALSGEVEAGLKLLEKAVTRAPQNASLAFNYGTTLLIAKQIPPAIKELRRAIRGDKIYLNEIQQLGNQHFRGERLPEALACFTAANSVAPNNPQILHCLALIYLYAGEMDLAQKTLRDLREVAPKNTDAFLLLAENNWLTDEDIAAAKTLANVDDLWQLQYALGWINERENDVEKAFKHFSRANEIYDRDRQVNAKLMTEQMASHVNLLGRNFNASFFQRFKSKEETAPIFIVGMPRSGCRLLSKLLAVDATLGETGCLEWFNQKMYHEITRNQNNFALMLNTVNEELLNEWRAEFLRECKNTAPHHPRFIVNNPTNFLNLWLIALMFPRAKIIHVTREVHEAAIAAYQHHSSLAFTADLNSYGRYYRYYNQIIDLWKRCLPTPICEVDYNELVSETATTLARVQKFCDLSTTTSTPIKWAKRCLDYERGVICEPAHISRAVIGQAEKYQNYLSPLKTGLATVAPSMEASPLFNFLEQNKPTNTANNFAGGNNTGSGLKLNFNSNNSAPPVEPSKPSPINNDDLAEFKVDF